MGTQNGSDGSAPPSAPAWLVWGDRLVLLAALVGLAFLAWDSLAWRMQHDTPMMMYQAMLIEEFGFQPFRDFFDMNLPGTYLIFATIGKVLGYGDLAVRVAELVVLGAIGLLLVLVLRRLSLRAGIFAALLFLLLHLRVGPVLALQRDLLLLVPVLGGLLIATSTRFSPTSRAVLAGLAFGFASTIKPQAAIGLVPVWLYLVTDRADGQGRCFLRQTCILAVGFLAPLGVMVAWLAASGLLGDFVHSLGYLKYYGAMDGEHHVLEGAERWRHVLDQYLTLGPLPSWVGLGAFGFLAGLWAVRRQAAERRVVLVLGGSFLAYFLYPGASGQFWPYHWIPMACFAAACLSSLVGPLTAAGSPVRAVVGRLLVLGGLWFVSFGAPWLPLEQHAQPPAGGRADAIAAFLRENLREGETVQALDWVAAGATHGMLMAQARPATKYLYSFHFHHHVSTPYIQDLRADFLAQFDEARPAFVIEGWDLIKGRWASGEDTEVDFPALQSRLEAEFRPVVEEQGYRIWEHVGRTPPHVLLLTVDTLRADHLSRNGFPFETTPFLDELIARGTYFEQAITPIPRTTQALASLLTGLYPQNHGLRSLHESLAHGTSIAKTAKERGYRTIAVVSNHVLGESRGLNAGFDVYDFASDIRGAQKTTQDALWHVSAADPNTPLFLWVHYIDPHVPYHSPPKYIEAFAPGYDGRYATNFGEPNHIGGIAYPEDLPKAQAVFRNPLSDEVNDHVRALYAADIRRTDDGIRTLLEGLRAERGDDWLVVFTSDHGESLGEHDYFYDHGDYVYQAGLHVPLAFIDLRTTGPGRVAEDPVSLVDVVPTLLDLLGWRADPADGRSLRPMVRGEDMELRPVFAESGKSYFPDYVKRRQEFTVQGRFRAAILGSRKVIYTPGLEDDAWEFYDLGRDPAETENLWETHGDAVQDVRAALRAWSKLDGAVDDGEEISPDDLEILRSLGYVDDR